MRVLFSKEKLLNLTTCLVICFLTFLSCKHEKEKLPIKPELSFTGGVFSVSQEIEIQAGRKIEVRLKLSSNSDKKLKSLKIERLVNKNSVTIKDIEINKNEFEYIDSLETLSEEGLEEWLFTVADTLNNKETKSVKLIKKRFLPEVVYICKDTILETGEEFILSVRAQSNSVSNEKLSRFKIIRKLNNQIVTEVDSAISTEIFSFAEKLKANEQEGKENWIISVSDVFNEKDSVVFNITTNENQNKEYFGKIWNFQSDSASAWDIVEDKPMFPEDDKSGKDLRNPSEQTFPPYHFTRLIESVNGTLYRRYNEFDYDNATQQSMLDGFSGGTISINPPSPVTLINIGDIYLLKLREEDKYAVIKILDIVYTENDHLDHIIFSYKK